MLCVLAPFDHKKEVKFDTLKVVLDPAQTCKLPLIDGDAALLIVKTTDALAVHPEPFVTVTL
jgi:hypothetical protein